MDKIKVACNNLNEIIKALDTIEVKGYSQAKTLSNIVEAIAATANMLASDNNKDGGDNANK